MDTEYDDLVCRQIYAPQSNAYRDKMAAIFADDIFKCIFLNKKLLIFK